MEKILMTKGENLDAGGLETGTTFGKKSKIKT